MSPDPRLTDLLLRWEELRERGLAPTPEELCRDCPELAAPLRDAIARLADLEPILDTIPNAPPAPVPPPAPAAGRYRRLALHARGGLGEVFLAEDEELRRQVALKEIQPRFADQADSRARFLREGEVTAQLEHPGIVPVYGLNRYADGRPYYAMRLIKGESLHDAITRFHQADDRPGRDAGERALALRGLLARFVAVCDAVGYAHSRGVIHRDLKPANVMLGEYGETYVVDWGLAKVLERGELSTAFDEPVALSSGGATPTREGRAAGTPAFMPPEQARGEWDNVGPPSDVFSLGATLYALLAGQAPYTGPDALAQAARALAPPARQVNARVPAALSAVCARAMAARPEGRYRSARALAGDVERWLADEPVSAYRDPLSQKLRRWGKRHRTLVTAAAVLLVASVVGLAGGLAAVRAEQRETATQLQRAVTAEALASERLGQVEQNLERAEKAEGKARENLARSEANYALAKKAVDDCYGIAQEHPLFEQSYARADVSELRALLLKSALPFYENFLVQKGGDAALLSAKADHLWRAGAIHIFLANWKDARRALAEAAEVFRQVPPSHGNAAARRVQQAFALNLLAGAQEALGEAEAAAASYAEAEKLIGGEGGAARPTLRQRKEWALGRFLLAYQHQRAGKQREALRGFQQAAEAFRQLCDARPNDAGYRGALFAALKAVAEMQQKLGATGEAEKSYSEALAHGRRLIKAGVPNAVVGIEIGKAALNLGHIQLDARRLKEARDSYATAVSLLREAGADAPGLSLRDQLPIALSFLGFAQRELGELREALANYREAADLFRRLARGPAGDPTDARSRLANALAHIAGIQQALGEDRDILATRREAIALYRELAAAQPDVLLNWQEMGRLQTACGGAVAAAGRPGEARQYYADAEAAYAALLDLTRRAVRAQPADVAYRGALVLYLGEMGYVQAALNKREEALKRFREKIELGQQMLPEYAARVELHDGLSQWLHDFAVLQQALGRRASARGSYLAALGWRRRVLDVRPRDAAQRGALALTLMKLGEVERELKLVPASLDNLAKAVALRRELAGEQPEQAQAQKDLALALYQLALSQQAAGQPEQQARSLTALIAAWGAVVKAEPQDQAVAFELARAYLMRSALRQGPDELRDRVADLNAGLKILEAVKKRTQVPGLDPFLYPSYLQRAAARTALNEPREALADWDRALALAPKEQRHLVRIRRAAGLARAGEHDRAAAEAVGLAGFGPQGEMAYEVARALALSAAGAAGDEQRPLPRRERDADDRARRAVVLLARAAWSGLFRNPAAVAHLDKDADFDFLRGRDDYRRFRGGLGKK